MTLLKLEPNEFSDLIPLAHAIAFREERPADMNRFSFCLVGMDRDEIIAYATVIEMDKTTAYMQHGGAMPNIKGSILSKRCYNLMIEWLKARYARISTRIQNTNIPMIKFALSEGFLIDGCILYEREVFLSLGIGF